MTKEYEPFDLERALAGEPVILRDGSKAYVRYCESVIQTNYPLMGIGAWEGHYIPTTWSRCGKQFTDHDGSLDIIGMWPQYRLINGVKVPVFPDWEPEIGEIVNLVRLDVPGYVFPLEWEGNGYCKMLLERGLVYPPSAAGKQAAILHAKAMLGIAEDNDASN